MQDNSKSDIIIRNMTYSDVPLIVIPEIQQEGQNVPEKYYSRLEEQKKVRV